MRRFLPVVSLIFALVAPAFAQASGPAPAPGAVPAGAEPYGPDVLLAKEDSVPVRTDPGFVYREIRFLKKGQEVVVDARKGTWFHIRPEGWVLADHVQTKEEAEATSPLPAATTKTMAAVREGVRIRTSPSTDAEVSKTLAAGEQVQVTGQEAGWWKVDGGGYVAAALLKDVSGDAAADAAAAPAEPAVRGPVPFVVSSDTANVRADRNAQSPVVRKLARGEIVPVTGVQDGWAAVPDGFIRADLLQPPAARPAAQGSPVTERPQRGKQRRWSLVDLNGVIFEVADLTNSPLVPSIKAEMASTGMLTEDWTLLGITIGVPEDAPYRFNFAADKNTVVIVDEDGQRYGNVYARGPFEKLPMQVRQFFLPATIAQGEKWDGLLMFRPTLKGAKIKEISMFIGGRMQRFYETSN